MRPTRIQIELSDRLVDGFLANGVLDGCDRQRERRERPTPPSRRPVYGWCEVSRRIDVLYWVYDPTNERSGHPDKPRPFRQTSRNHQERNTQ